MKTPVVIIGGGPGGAAAALYLAREGIESVIVEREEFPRYHIGESMNGEAGWLMRDLGLESRMLADRHPLKHGVNVWGTNGKTRWWVPVMQRLEDGSMKEQFTWQVRRSSFDKMMLDTALDRGTRMVRGRARQPLIGDDGAVCGVEVQTDDGRTMKIHSQMLLDCSGQATWLASRGVTGPKYLGAYDKQIAVFAHVTGFRRDEPGSEMREKQPSNTLIFYKEKYHWAWAIPIDDEVTSIGIVSPLDYYKGKGESKPDYVMRELRELNPELAERASGARIVDEVHVIPNYSLQVKNFAGRGYICVGDAHRFIDPIFSFGLYVTMKEASHLAPVVRDYLNGKDRESMNPFEDYMIKAERGADIFEDIIDTFWENPLAFAYMAHRSNVKDIIDVFAGRVFTETPSEGVQVCRKILKRERTYEPGGDYSVPIGSRYCPERAPIWNANLDGVETTETWMRDLVEA